MKAIKLLLIGILASFALVSCTSSDDYYYSDNNQDFSQILQQYDLWEIDHSRTTGNTSIPFLDRAITTSFINGVLYANNNFSGFGYTGNGFGIDVGVYGLGINSTRISHDIYGVFDFDVIFEGANRIRLYNRAYNITYYLFGYSKSNYNYDLVFYNNIGYFLQEFQAWRKVYTSSTGALNPFDNENIINFDTQGNVFLSSTYPSNTNLGSIYWNYEGIYDVFNTNNLNTKILRLDYGIDGMEEFFLTIINDSRIRLEHTSGTIYEFEGTSYIQFLRTNFKTTEMINKQ